MATAEIQFARKLASNDLETRQKSEKELKKWLSVKATKGMEEMELRRLWKGLFASMFMSDKPLVQEQLADDLSALLQLFPKYEQGMLFCRIFFDTMVTEWKRIDSLRLNKFYMFIRRFIQQSFIYLHAQGWPESAVRQLMEAITCHHEKCPGVVLHIIELFLPELQNTLRDKLSIPNSHIILESWLRLAASSKDIVLVQAIKESILNRIIKGYKMKWLSVDWKDLTTTVWRLASDKDILTRNRKILYEFHTGIEQKDK